MTRQYNEERRKQQIRAAAIRCFVRRGFTATRLSDIAREAQLSKGGVYFHFRTKEALFQDVIAHQVESLASRWSFTPDADQPAARTLRRLVIAHLRTLEDEPEHTRLGHLLLAMAPRELAFRERLEETLVVMRSLYSAVIARGVADGEFVDEGVDHLTTCVLALVQGLACQAAVDATCKLPITPEAAAQTVLRILQPEQRATASVERKPATEALLPV